MSTPSADTARETARQDNGRFGEQPLTEVPDVVLDEFDDPAGDYERAHDLADDVISNLNDDGLRDFLLANGVAESEIPDDEDDLDEKARDLMHDMAANAINSSEVDEFVSTWTGGKPAATADYPHASHPNHWARHGHAGEPCRADGSCYGGAIYS